MVSSGLIHIPGSVRSLESQYDFQFVEYFNSDTIDPAWTTGGFGILGINSGSTLTVTKFVDKGTTEDWHGPWARTKVPASPVFDVEVTMKCSAEVMSIARADLRLMDPFGNQFLSFSWKDVSVSDSRSSITLYGIDDSDVLYSSEEDFKYSIFTHSEINIVHENGDLSLSIDGEVIHSRTSEGFVLGYVQLHFLKYQKRCIPGSIAFDRVIVRSVRALPPDPPSANIRSSSVVGPEIEIIPPDDDGGARVISYSIYRGYGPSDIEYLTSVGRNRSFIDGTAIEGMEYQYQITAVSGA
jgi:hypothetical protein